MRCLAITVVVLLMAGITDVPTALAIAPPEVDRAMVPADGPPSPDQPMRQSNLCATAIAASEPDVARPAPGFAMLNIADAWRFSTGAGVSVAVIDTGVTPSPRLPAQPGGDYILGGDGLSDCDAHGTIVASVIAAKASSTDGVVGVAPDASVISIRQSSRAFAPNSFGAGDVEARRKAGTIGTLARAIVHAANLGARVINVSVTACVSSAEPLDQRAIGAAVWYAAAVKDAVIVAAAGNEGEEGCAQNPTFGPLNPGDPRDWTNVRTISSPSWFSDHVLSVGAVTPAGTPIDKSLAGPWVGIAAPGTGVVGLSPQSAGPVNAHPPMRPGEKAIPFWGTSFSAAYVTGVAALVRAKYPHLSAQQIVNRILRTAHNPARGVDNAIGHGLVDPVAALTFDIPPGATNAPTELGAESRVLTPPAAPPPPDHRGRNVAIALGILVGAGAVLIPLLSLARRSR
ncbi:MAG: type VII secretion-associated serine protease mycosin [Mycobacterium sp.]